MSYYGKMNFDKANAEARAKRVFGAKVDHYESNKQNDCICDDCLEVVKARLMVATQEFNRVEWFRKNGVTPPRAKHVCKNGTSISQSWDAERKAYVCRNCNEEI